MIGPGDHPHAAWPTLAPGTVLDAVLETFDPRSLPERDLIQAIAGCERQVAHLHALQARLIAELSARAGYRSPGPERGDAGRAERQPAAAREVGSALTLASDAAAERVLLAVELLEHLPATLAALDTGRITLDRAGVIAERTRHLSPATRVAVEAAAVERAPQLTAQQLHRWLNDALRSAKGDSATS